MRFYSAADKNNAQIKLKHLFTISKVGPNAEDIVAGKWFSCLEKLAGIKMTNSQNNTKIAQNINTPKPPPVQIKRSSSPPGANLPFTKIPKISQRAQMTIEHLPQLNELYQLITAFNAINDKNAKSIDQIFDEIGEKSKVKMIVLSYDIAGENIQHKNYFTDISIGTLTVVKSNSQQEKTQAIESAKKEVISFIDNARIAAECFHQG